MERLTNKREADAQRKDYENRIRNGYPRNIPEERFLRLAAYEDRGCAPEEVLPKDKADEIALKLMRLADLESLCSYTRLRELAEADKDGRLVVPCKVGDTVYFRTYDCNGTVDLGIQPHKVTAIAGVRHCPWEIYRCRAVTGPVRSKLVPYPRGGGKSIGGDEGCLT